MLSGASSFSCGQPDVADTIIFGEGGGGGTAGPLYTEASITD